MERLLRSSDWSGEREISTINDRKRIFKETVKNWRSHSNIGMETLIRSFYRRSPEQVAMDLLGKRLVRRIEGARLSGLIVETEAYYGPEDPASRAREGRKNYNRLMWSLPGLAFIYNVHNYWMFNIVAHRDGEAGAVLIRAIEPKEGIEIMKKNRKVEDIIQLTNGPGKLTRALRIDKSLNGTDVTDERSEIFIADREGRFEVASSHRIGVKRDLNRELRFYIKGNRFVSR